MRIAGMGGGGKVLGRRELGKVRNFLEGFSKVEGKLSRHNFFTRRAHHLHHSLCRLVGVGRFFTLTSCGLTRKKTATALWKLPGERRELRKPSYLVVFFPFYPFFSIWRLRALIFFLKKKMGRMIRWRWPIKSPEFFTNKNMVQFLNLTENN